MKKYLEFIKKYKWLIAYIVFCFYFLIPFLFSIVHAQTLWSDSFETYTLGILGSPYSTLTGEFDVVNTYCYDGTKCITPVNHGGTENNLYISVNFSGDIYDIQFYYRFQWSSYTDSIFIYYNYSSISSYSYCQFDQIDSGNYHKYNCQLDTNLKKMRKCTDDTCGSWTDSPDITGQISGIKINDFNNSTYDNRLDALLITNDTGDQLSFTYPANNTQIYSQNCSGQTINFTGLCQKNGTRLTFLSSSQQLQELNNLTCTIGQWATSTNVGIGSFNYNIFDSDFFLSSSSVIGFGTTTASTFFTQSCQTSGYSILVNSPSQQPNNYYEIQYSDNWPFQFKYTKPSSNTSTQFLVLQTDINHQQILESFTYPDTTTLDPNNTGFISYGTNGINSTIIATTTPTYYSILITKDWEQNIDCTGSPCVINTGIIDGFILNLTVQGTSDPTTPAPIPVDPNQGYCNYQIPWNLICEMIVPTPSVISNYFNQIPQMLFTKAPFIYFNQLKNNLENINSSSTQSIVIPATIIHNNINSTVTMDFGTSKFESLMETGRPYITFALYLILIFVIYETIVTIKL